MNRAGRIRQQSAKRKAEQEERAWVRSQVLTRASWTCEAVRLVPHVTCSPGPLDVDEVIPRSAYPGGHLDPGNCQALCRAHHDWKHAHPLEAAEIGLRKWSWDR